MSVYYLPWWGLLACLAASALVSYLVLERTQAGDSPWALFPLTAALAPVILLGAMVVAITLSTLFSAIVEERTGTPAGEPEPPPARTEHTRRSSPTTTVEGTHPATTTGDQQPTATPTPTATATATSTATASP